MRIALLGFGLIGGSIALALRRTGGAGPAVPWQVAAWSPRSDGPRRALDGGVVDRAPATIEDALDGAELVVVAAPPLATLDLLDRLAGPLAPAVPATAVITDVASTKAAIVERARTLGLRFVGGHPMAGREASGYAASDPELFVGRPWIVVPSDDASLAAPVEALIAACGARSVHVGASEHDAAVAAISHLPLVLAASLVESVAASSDWPLARELAASGWRDMTRLARGDVAMGAGILATNRSAIALRVRDLRETLDRWLDDLDREADPDADRLAARLAAARDRLEGGPA